MNMWNIKYVAGNLARMDRPWRGEQIQSHGKALKWVKQDLLWLMKEVMNLQPRFVDCKLLGRRATFPRLRQLLRSLTHRWWCDSLVTQQPEGTGPGGRGAMPSRNLKGDGNFVAISVGLEDVGNEWFLSVRMAQFQFGHYSKVLRTCNWNAKFQEEPVVADQVLKDALEKIADSGLVAKSSTAQLVKWQAKKASDGRCAVLKT